MPYQIIKIDHDEGLHRIYYAVYNDQRVATLRLKQMLSQIRAAYPASLVEPAVDDDGDANWDRVMVIAGAMPEPRYDSHQVIAEYHIVEVASDDQNFV